MSENDMPRWSADLLEKNFRLFKAAAVADERCPQNHPHGPVNSGAVSALIKAKRIRSEVYAKNYRVVTILTGQHKGKSTAPATPGESPYLVNGVHVGRRKIAP
jgi:hypothetical protein